MRPEALFPLARCGTCGRHDLCGPRGRTEPDYPRCHRPLLRGHLRRHEELFAALCSEANLAEEDPARALVTALLRRFDRDRRTVSEVLEPSISWGGPWSGGGGAEACGHPLRFSYAFHGYRRDVRGASASVREMLAPFGTDELRFAEPILRLAEEEPAVHQMMFGYAHDGAGRQRLKLYLQLADGAGERAGAIAEALWPGAAAMAPFGPLPLHLIGIDFFAGRALGAKLYFQQARCALDDEVARRSPLLAALRDSGVPVLRDLLWIARLEASGPGGAEIDFALADNELLWSHLSSLPPLARHLEAEGLFGRLARRFRLAVRRLSVPVDRSGGEEAGKLNVYYMLAESER